MNPWGKIMPTLSNDVSPIWNVVSRNGNNNKPGFAGNSDMTQKCRRSSDSVARFIDNEYFSNTM